MSDYISKEKLWNALYDADAITFRGLKILNQFPAADVQPVRCGVWNERHWAEEVGGYLISNFDCSVCGNPTREKTPYCPNCGAHMEEGSGAKNEQSDKLQWIRFTTRSMTDEERDYWDREYGFHLSDDEAVVYDSPLPEDGQEVLVCDICGHVWVDVFCADSYYGIGFETNGDMDGLVAWMPLPVPPVN